MSRNEDIRRIVIAMTDSSPVAELWEAAMEAIRDSRVELVAVYLHDERWEHAASLPFTQEVSLIGGSATDFTLRRAEQLLAETVALMRKQVEQLASEAGLPVEFEVLPESDKALVQALFGRDKILVVAPPILREHRIFRDLRELAQKILLIETENNRD